MNNINTNLTKNWEKLPIELRTDLKQSALWYWKVLKYTAIIAIIVFIVLLILALW